MSFYLVGLTENHGTTDTAQLETRGDYFPGFLCRNGEDWRSDRLVLNKEVMALGGVRKFLPFLDQVAQDFVTFMQRRVNKNSRGTLTVDLYSDLFRFTLEASSYVLYGARLGLLEENPNSESLRFITAVQTMLRTTLPLLFMPPALLQRMNSKLWTEHVTAWDTIFDHAEKCIQNIYQEFCLGQERKYCGIMAELLLQGELSLDSIKANITELMAGGVDTVKDALCMAVKANTERATVGKGAMVRVSGSVDTARVTEGMAMVRVSGSVDTARVAVGVAMVRVSGSVDTARVAEGVAMVRVSGSVDTARVTEGVTMVRVSGSVDTARVTEGVAMVRVSGSVDTARVTEGVAMVRVSGSVDTARVTEGLAMVRVSGSVDTARVTEVVAMVRVSGSMDRARVTEGMPMVRVSGSVDTARVAEGMAMVRGVRQCGHSKGH
ncbi:hypothetical protein NDU88_004636 [Pleurodeles waltl]|uniref:Uncharacterized protein n=1 Tax=Pleurodeles waltl TaxID=8319 RepID=A0AAV7V3Z7_PLEWA|nr:hypothetical protein NDU88_004636 [Pleurodeles waltl]